MNKMLTSIIIALCILHFSCESSMAQTEIEKEFEGITIIDISTVSGSCAIIESSDEHVHIRLKYQYKRANTFKPIFRQDNNVLRLEEKMTGSNSGNSNWEISVPTLKEIKFNSASGSISLTSIKGKFEINTASGDVDGINLWLSGSSTFSSASGSVNISVKETPKFQLSASSASGDATIDFNQNPIIGLVEMKARVKLGKIVCPFKFDAEKETEYGGQKYWTKSFQIEKKTPLIKIHTASGKAVLKK